MQNSISDPKRIEDFFILLFRHRKLIIKVCLLITIMSIIISFLLPVKFTAQSSFISPKRKALFFGEFTSVSTSLSSLSRLLGGRAGNVTEDAYNYLVILKSRTASEKIIDKFNLRKVYEIDDEKPFEDVLMELESNVKFNVEDEGNIVIYVTDEDPNRAQQIANYYLEIVNEMSLKFSTQEAKNNRIFLEDRVNEIFKRISDIEDSLKLFSKKYNVLEIKDQVKNAVQLAADLKTQIEIVKLEKEIMEKTFGPEHPSVLQVKLKLDQMSKNFENLKTGRDKEVVDFLIPFKNVPDIGIKYISLMRDYEIQVKLLEFAYPLYEQAKIDEQKNIPVIVVVDYAKPPQKKSSPKRILIVLSSFLFSIILGVSFALLSEQYNKLKKDQNRYDKIYNEIIVPLRLIFTKNKQKK